MRNRRQVIALMLSVVFISISGCSNNEAVSSQLIQPCDLKEELIPYVEQVPDCVLNDLYENDYSICVVNQPGERFGIKYVNGITDTAENVIYIKNHEGKFRQTVVHEIGHAWDDCKSFPSRSVDFLAIYDEEKDSLKDTENNIEYCKSNPQEYFAEAFQQYVLKGEVLRESSPKTYAFINTLVLHETAR